MTKQNVGKSSKIKEDTRYRGLTEQEFHLLVKEVIKGYSYRYSFTYQTPEDVEQRAYIHAQEGIKKYDPNKGELKHFLRVHIRNRLMNDKRKFFIRNDPPCLNCPLNAYVNNVCTAYKVPEEECEYFKPWFKRNNSRKTIAMPIHIEEVDPIGEKSMEYQDVGESSLMMQEIWEKIETNIPNHLKDKYTIWKTGYREGNKRRTKLSETDIKLVQEYIKERVGYLFE